MRSPGEQAVMRDEPAGDARERYFDSLMEYAAGGENIRYLASMLASWYAGEGVLPAFMGLTTASFSAMMQRFFPGFGRRSQPVHACSLSDMPERAELAALFAAYRVDTDEQRGWIADMLIAGCAGRRHLWEDMGLFSRADLTKLIRLNFPELAVRNARDMKWKKFIYKQLCEREGIIACPAPTCDACADFSVCFAPEDEPSG